MPAMKTTTQPLPDDPQKLQQMVLQMQAQLAQKDTLILTLQQQLLVLRRRQFGRSSEQVGKQIHQIELQLEELETQAAQTADVTLPGAQKKDAPKRRVALPSHLPREEKRIEPDKRCPDCSGELKHIGEDVSEVLDVVPASYRVIKIVRPKYSCSCCDKLIQGDAPQRVIPKGLASSALLTQVMVDKYLDHQPLYRQSERMAREGVDIERSTLAGWVGQVSTLISPLVDAIGKHVKSAHHIYADDTTAPTLKPGKGKTQTGRYWTYVRDGRDWNENAPPAVWLQYSEDRKSLHPTSHLKGYAGSLQTDAYAGYNDIYHTGVTFTGCWAHVRRKFYDIIQSGPSPIAQQAIATIQQLYAIEKSIKNKPPDERQKVRQQQAIPILDELHTWLQNTLRTLSKGSSLSKAVRYALNQWEGLLAYTQNGQASIDNNTAERSLRPIALGRKNYLFAGSVAGGQRAAALYSLLSTAKLNGLNPSQYLTAVLKRIGQHPINRVDELLPWNIDLTHTHATDAL
jgi:transposase